MPAPPKFTNVEEQPLHRKQKLAGALRLFGRFGFSEGVAGHIRDPVTDHFWIRSSLSFRLRVRPDPGERTGEVDGNSPGGRCPSLTARPTCWRPHSSRPRSLRKVWSASRPLVRSPGRPERTTPGARRAAVVLERGGGRPGLGPQGHDPPQPNGLSSPSAIDEVCGSSRWSAPARHNCWHEAAGTVLIDEGALRNHSARTAPAFSFQPCGRDSRAIPTVRLITEVGVRFGRRDVLLGTLPFTGSPSK